MGPRASHMLASSVQAEVSDQPHCTRLTLFHHMDDITVSGSVNLLDKQINTKLSRFHGTVSLGTHRHPRTEAAIFPIIQRRG